MQGERRAPVQRVGHRRGGRIKSKKKLFMENIPLTSGENFQQFICRSRKSEKVLGPPILPYTHINVGLHSALPVLMNGTIRCPKSEIRGSLRTRVRHWCQVLCLPSTWFHI